MKGWQKLGLNSPSLNERIFIRVMKGDTMIAAIRFGYEVKDWPNESEWTYFTSDQLQLFPESKEDRLQREVLLLRDQLDRIRRAQFAKIGEISKKYNELMNEFIQLKESICRTHTLKQKPQQELQLMLAS
jgi:hypothetical protein